MRSALAQVDAEIELLVVGDGVEDDTRRSPRALPRRSQGPASSTARKGERHGELLRHEALRESTARSSATSATTTSSFPGTFGNALELLRPRRSRDRPPRQRLARREHPLDFAFDLVAPEFLRLLAEGRAGGGLTGTSHTRDSYERLPFGWRPAPPSSDRHLHAAAVPRAAELHRESTSAAVDFLASRARFEPR